MTKKAMNYQVDHLKNFFKDLLHNFKDVEYVTNQQLHHRLHPNEKQRLTEDEQFQQALEHVANTPIQKDKHLQATTNKVNSDDKMKPDEASEISIDANESATPIAEQNFETITEPNQSPIIGQKINREIEGQLNHQLVMNQNQNWYFNNDEQPLFEESIMGNGSIVKNDGSIKNSNDDDYVIYVTKLKDRNDSELYQGLFNTKTQKIELTSKKPLIKLSHLKDPYVFKCDKKWIMYAINTNDDSLMIYQSRNGFNFRFVKNLSFENLTQLQKPQIIKIKQTNDDEKKESVDIYFLSLNAVQNQQSHNLIAIGDLDRKGVFETTVGFQNIDAGDGLHSVYFQTEDNQLHYQGTTNYGDLIQPRQLNYQVINQKPYLLTDMENDTTRDVNAVNEIYGNQLQALLLPKQQLNLTLTNLNHDLRKAIQFKISNGNHDIHAKYQFKNNLMEIDKHPYPLVNAHVNLNDDICHLVIFLNIHHITIWFKDLKQIVTLDTQELNLNQPISIQITADETLLFKSQTSIIKNQKQRLINYIDIQKHVIKTLPITSHESISALDFIPYGYHYLTGSKESINENIDVVIEPNGLPEAETSMSETIANVKNSSADKIESYQNQYSSAASSQISAITSSANSVVSSTTNSVAQYTNSMDAKYDSNITSITTSYNTQLSNMTSTITSSAYRKIKDSADVSLHARIHEIAEQQSQQATSIAASQIRANKAYFKAQEKSLIDSAIDSTTDSLNVVMSSNVSAATASVSDELTTSYETQITQLEFQISNLTENMTHLEFENHKLINEKNQNNYTDLVNASDDIENQELDFNEILNDFKKQKVADQKPKKPAFTVPYGIVNIDLTKSEDEHQVNHPDLTTTDHQPDLTNQDNIDGPQSKSKTENPAKSETVKPTDQPEKLVKKSKIKGIFHKKPKKHVETMDNPKTDLNDNIPVPKLKTKSSEQPVETKVEQPIKSKVEQPIKSKVEKPVETKVKQPVETKVEQPVESKGEQPVESKGEQPVESKGEQPVESKIEQPVESKVEKIVEPKVEKIVEPKVEKPVKPKVEKIVEPKVEKPVKPKVEKPVKPKVEKPVEPKVEQSVESKVKQPVESKVEKPVEHKVDQSVEPKGELKSDVQIENEIEQKVENDIKDKTQHKNEANTSWANDMDSPKPGFFKRFIKNILPDEKNNGKLKYLKLNQDIIAQKQNGDEVKLQASHQPDLQVIDAINRDEKSKRYTVKYRNDTLKFNAKNDDVENLYYTELPDGDGLKPVTIDFLTDVYEYDEKNFNGVNPTRLFHPGDHEIAIKIIPYRDHTVIQLEDRNFITSNKYKVKLS